MKTLVSLALILLSGTSFAYHPEYSELITTEVHIDSTEEELTSDHLKIQGRWLLAQRRCLSGAPVLDGYNPRRDRTQIQYTDTKFHYESFVNGCSYSSKGSYELSGPFIVYKNIRSTSTCGGVSFKTREQNPYKVNDISLELFFGPFVQGPAPCPMGDTLEVSYLKML